MTREEYVDFDFDVAYYNLACVCWRLGDDAGCQAALTVCLYLEIASEFEDGEEARAYSQQVGLTAAVGGFAPEGQAQDAMGGKEVGKCAAQDAHSPDPGRMNELSALMSLVLQIRNAGGASAGSGVGIGSLAAAGAGMGLSVPAGGRHATSRALVAAAGASPPLMVPFPPCGPVVPPLTLPPVPVAIHSSRLYQDVRNDSELAGIENKTWFQSMFLQA